LPIFWCHRRVGSRVQDRELAVIDWVREGAADACKSGGSVVCLSSDRKRYEAL
jgi:hypothetical protein